MLPCLLFLTFGMVVGETCDAVFQDSIHAEDSIKECVTSLMKDFANNFESIRKTNDKLIKSMQTEIEILKNDNLVYRKDIDQLEFAYREQLRHFKTKRPVGSYSLIPRTHPTPVKDEPGTFHQVDTPPDDMSASLLTGLRSPTLSILDIQGLRSPTLSTSSLSRGLRSPTLSTSSISRGYAHLCSLHIDPAITPVAFHAILGHQVTDPGNDHELSFENVITNIGNSYSPNTGAFTAYQPGTYVFSWEITVTASQYMDTHLLKNGGIVGSIKTWGYYGSGSTSSGTAVLDLDGRDEVWVRVGDHTSGADVLANYSMFSGFRMY